MKYAIHITFILFNFLSFAQNSDTLVGLNSFELVVFPDDNYFDQLSHGIGPDEEWRCIKKNDQLFFYDQHEARYFGDSLLISIDEFENKIACKIGGGRYHILKVSDGWYLGTNKGEWGGQLFWISANYKTCSLICRANVNQLYSFNNKRYLIEGLSHLSLSRGNIIEISSEQKLDTLLHLNETPRHMTFSSDSSGYILTDSRILKINSEFDTVQLYQNSKWPYVYPNEIIYHDEKLYIPMRGGIAVYFIRTQEMKWLRKIE